MTDKFPILNLQDIIDSYADPAVIIAESFEIICANAAYMELYNLHHKELSKQPVKNSCELRAADGKIYCYEVSHHYQHSCEHEGESCPLQLAKTTKNNQRVLHVHQTRFGEEHVDVSLFPIKDERGTLYFLEIMKTIRHASPKSIAQGMVGKAPSFNKLLALINRVAEYDISVLLQGESGSGKELVAYAIHQASTRENRACVTVECSGLSESLFESELFGHEKGAFTGAINKKKGLVEEANGGTLFLDEIGDIPLNLQVKLLRLIETQTFRKVGGVEQLNSNFRLICATHKNLQEMVKKGEFREDLYYRISTFPIQLPALRERIEDIPLLVESILERICRHKLLKVSNEVLVFFAQYSFPGNIRQLRNILESGRVMTDSNIIELKHLPDSLFSVSAINEVHHDVSALDKNTTKQLVTLQQNENEYITWSNKHFGEDKKYLAEKLGVSERTLYRKLKKL